MSFSITQITQSSVWFTSRHSANQTHLPAGLEDCGPTPALVGDAWGHHAACSGEWAALLQARCHFSTHLLQEAGCNYFIKQRCLPPSLRLPAHCPEKWEALETSLPHEASFPFKDERGRRAGMTTRTEASPSGSWLNKPRGRRTTFPHGLTKTRAQSNFLYACDAPMQLWSLNTLLTFGRCSSFTARISIHWSCYLGGKGT